MISNNSIMPSFGSFNPPPPLAAPLSPPTHFTWVDSPAKVSSSTGPTFNLWFCPNCHGLARVPHAMRPADEHPPALSLQLAYQPIGKGEGGEVATHRMILDL
jgi:hypothetical protein